MRGTRNRSTSTDPNAPYYVLLRDAERKILRDALEYHDGNESAAAAMLGISHTLVGKRARLLGGVYPDDPRREPFHYATAMTSIKHDYQKGKTFAKRRHDDHDAEASVLSEDRSSDERGRGSEGDHTEQERHHDEGGG